MLSVKQGGIKYHFSSLWYDSTWKLNTGPWAIGEHSNHYGNELVYSKHNFAYAELKKKQTNLVVKGLKMESIGKRLSA